MRYRAYKKVSRQCWRWCQRYPHQKQYVPLPFGGVISPIETKSMLVKHNDSQKCGLELKKKKESQPTNPFFFPDITFYFAWSDRPFDLMRA